MQEGRGERRSPLPHKFDYHSYSPPTAFDRTRLGDPKAPHLVYVDESGMDERDNYGYGYAPAGERFYDLKSGRRQGRINMIAGYRDGELIAPFTVEGSCNRSVFEIWLETCLIPRLRPGEWVIVDNATFPERRSDCPIN